MIVSLILAMSENRGIGKGNRLPWHLPADLKHFKALTMGHHLIMGRKTFESIGNPLPGRTSIVITRNPDFMAEGCLIAHSLEEAVELADCRGEHEVFVIGGAEIYTAALGRADRIYLTIVHTHIEADIYFPEFIWSEWEVKEQWRHAQDGKNEYPFTYQVLERKHPPRSN